MQAVFALFFLLFWVFPVSAAGHFPVLESCSLYRTAQSEVAEKLPADTLKKTAAKPYLALYLLEKHFFFLQGSLPGKRQNTPFSATGYWHQSADGSLLQLENIQGFRYRCNVSGDGNVLYPDCLIHEKNGNSQTLQMQKAVFSVPQIRLTGILEADSAGNYTLRDISSNLRFAIAAPADQEFTQLPILLDVQAEYAGEKLQRVKIFSRTEQIPAAFLAQKSFQACTESISWRLPPLLGLETASCRFLFEEKKEAGIAQILGDGLHLEINFTARGDGTFAFAPKKADLAALQKLNLDSLKEMLTAQSWIMAAESLLLCGEKKIWFLAPVI